MKTRILAVIACCLFAACGGSQEVFRDATLEPGAVGFELPDPVAATPAFVARLDKPLRGPRLREVSRIPGVAVLAPVTVRNVKVTGRGAPERLRLGAVDPLPFRSVAPTSTRDAEFVWTSLMSDRAVITSEAAQQIGLRGAGQIAIRKFPIDVGAFADNGTPNIADVLVSTQVARGLRLGAPNLLVVGAKTGTTIQTLGKDLERKLPGVRLRRIESVTSTTTTQPAAPQQLGQVSGATIGTMTFRILSNGFIDPDDSWVAANITTGSVPILGSVHCHRILIPQLGAALGEIQKAGLASEIRTGDYGGCYVPRFIDRDPRRGLSMHAFGLAVDLNVSSNGLGSRGDMHPDIVRIFERWGFRWGGWWSRPDPMHFELARIVRPS
jgi:hypothetical protein